MFPWLAPETYSLIQTAISFDFMRVPHPGRALHPKSRGRSLEAKADPFLQKSVTWGVTQRPIPELGGVYTRGGMISDKNVKWRVLF